MTIDATTIIVSLLGLLGIIFGGLIAAIVPFLNHIQKTYTENVTALDLRLKEFKDIAFELRTENKGLRDEVTALKNENFSLRSEILELKKQINRWIEAYEHVIGHTLKAADVSQLNLPLEDKDG